MKSFIIGLFLSLSAGAFAAPAQRIPVVGTWQVLIRDGKLRAYGVGKLNFNEDNTIDGYVIVNKSVTSNDSGFFVLTGEWNDKAGDRITGFLNGTPNENFGPTDKNDQLDEDLTEPTPLTFVVESFNGTAVNGKKGPELTLAGKLDVREINIKGTMPEFDTVTLDSGLWNSKTMVKQEADADETDPTPHLKKTVQEFLDFEPSLLGYEGLYDVTGSGPTYTYVGCAAVDGAGHIALTATDDDDNRREVFGALKKGKGSLVGVDDSDQPVRMTLTE